MSTVTVEHRHYGCDCGCCGHVVLVDGVETGKFYFGHMWKDEESKREFSESVVRKVLGEEWVSNLDLDACDLQNGDTC